MLLKLINLYNYRELRERTAHALADEDVLAAKLHAGLVVRAGLAVLAEAELAGDHADQLVALEHGGGRGHARIDLDAQALGLAGQPAADVAQRGDVVAVVVHERRHGPHRQLKAALRPEQQEDVLVDRGLQRRPQLFPVGQQLVEALGVDDRAGQDMRADLCALFQHRDGDLGVELLQPDRRGQARGARADDDDVVFHRFPLDGLLADVFAHRVPLKPGAARLPRRTKLALFGVLSGGHGPRVKRERFATSSAPAACDDQLHLCAGLERRARLQGVQHQEPAQAVAAGRHPLGQGFGRIARAHVHDGDAAADRWRRGDVAIRQPAQAVEHRVEDRGLALGRHGHEAVGGVAAHGVGDHGQVDGLAARCRPRRQDHRIDAVDARALRLAHVVAAALHHRTQQVGGVGFKLTVGRAADSELGQDQARPGDLDAVGLLRDPEAARRVEPDAQFGMDEAGAVHVAAASDRAVAVRQAIQLAQQAGLVEDQAVPRRAAGRQGRGALDPVGGQGVGVHPRRDVALRAPRLARREGPFPLQVAQHIGQTIRRIAGGRQIGQRQAVGLVLLAARVAEAAQLGDAAGHLAGQVRLGRHAHQHGGQAAHGLGILLADRVVGGHVAQLMAQHRGQLGFGIDQAQKATGDIDVAARRRGEGVDHLAVDDGEDARLTHPRGLGHTVADPLHIVGLGPEIDTAQLGDHRPVFARRLRRSGRRSQDTGGHKPAEPRHCRHVSPFRADKPAPTRQEWRKPHQE